MSDAKQRMEKAYRADNSIGRYRLQKVADVGEKQARNFLTKKRAEEVGGGDVRRGKALLRLNESNVTNEELDVIIRSLAGKAEDGPTEYKWSNEKYSFIACGDSHWGHSKSKLDWWWRLCDVAAKNDVDKIYHGGDILEGMSGRPGHIYELDAIGFQRQFEIAKHCISQAPVMVEGIDGNHDQWYQGKANQGIVVGEQLQEALPGKYTHLGQDEATVTVGNVKIMLWHGADGSSYATSYRTQKFVEGLSGGEKPHVLLSAHAHKSLQHECRNVQVFEVGALCGQTKFMRGKKLPCHVGFWLIDVWQNETGLESIRGHWFPFLNS